MKEVEVWGESLTLRWNNKIPNIIGDLGIFRTLMFYFSFSLKYCCLPLFIKVFDCQPIFVCYRRCFQESYFERCVESLYDLENNSVNCNSLHLCVVVTPELCPFLLEVLIASDVLQFNCVMWFFYGTPLVSLVCSDLFGTVWWWNF